MPFARFTDGHEASVRLCDAVRAAINAAGPCDVRATTSEVAYRRRAGRAFAWVPHMYRRRGGLPITVTIGLSRRDESPRWTRVVEGEPGRFLHDLELSSEAEIDDDVRRWLREAWDQAGPPGRRTVP